MRLSAMATDYGGPLLALRRRAHWFTTGSDEGNSTGRPPLTGRVVKIAVPALMHRRAGEVLQACRAILLSG